MKSETVLSQDVSPLTFIENSFLKHLLADKDITDISYNGESIYYQNNFLGRCKSKIEISQNEAKDFIRQIANLTEKQFSYQTPILNVSIGKYRINAVHNSIGIKNNVPCITFSIRIGSEELKILDDHEFLSEKVDSLLEVLIKNNVSIVIGGATGTGKTELQKYLINKIEGNQRIVIIDNVLELEQVKYENKADLTFWKYDDKETNITVKELIKNALRSYPDWLIVAEARGGEMENVLNSAMSGHPIITTIHSLNAKAMPNRITRMIMQEHKNSSYEEIMNDIKEHFRFYVFLRVTKKANEAIYRYVSEIAYIYNGELKYVYFRKNNKESFSKIDYETLSELDYQKGGLFEKTFGGSDT